VVRWRVIVWNWRDTGVPKLRRQSFVNYWQHKRNETGKKQHKIIIHWTRKQFIETTFDNFVEYWMLGLDHWSQSGLQESQNMTKYLESFNK
jgi:hypothetical protein